MKIYHGMEILRIFKTTYKL